MEETSQTNTTAIDANTLLVVIFCDYGVERENSYIRLTDSVMRPFISHCKHKAKYKITATNSKGYQQTMNVCERHKRKIKSRSIFTIIKCVLLK